MRNLFAYTAPVPQPEYISINLVDDGVKITVRGKHPEGAFLAPEASIRLSFEQLTLLRKALAE